MKKSFIKRVGQVFGFLFLFIFFLLNIIAYNHAKKFSRYVENTGGERTRLDELSSLGKVNVIFQGINNPKPKNDSVPHGLYRTIKMGDERKLEAWELNAPEDKGTVILFHGYSSNKSAFVPHAEIIQALGWNALLVDFYGCGGSEGYESTIGFKEALDVKTAYDYVSLQSKKPIVLFGCSMGSAAVMKAVSENTVNPSKIILECPFGSMRSAVDVRVRVMGAPHFPFTDLFMFWGGALNGFWAYSHNPEEYAKHIQQPTLLLYGEKDERVPRSETDLIYERLAGPKKLVTFPESKHESYLNKYKTEWTAALAEFLNGAE